MRAAVIGRSVQAGALPRSVCVCVCVQPLALQQDHALPFAQAPGSWRICVCISILARFSSKPLERVRPQRRRFWTEVRRSPGSSSRRSSMSLCGDGAWLGSLGGRGGHRVGDEAAQANQSMNSTERDAHHLHVGPRPPAPRLIITFAL